MRTYIHVVLGMALLGPGFIPARADWIYHVMPEAIPDNNALGISQTLTLSGYTDPIASIQVNLVISGHNGGAFNGDLFVSLQHDSGYAVLLNRVGRDASNPFGYSDNGFNIVFNLSAPDIHTYQSGSYSLGPMGELTGTWGVDGRVTDPLAVVDTDARPAQLSSFHGLSPNGDWTLFVSDGSPYGEAVLSQWGLDITVVPEPSTIAFLAFGLASLFTLRRRCL